jgi:hypothetical protein
MARSTRRKAMSEDMARNNAVAPPIVDTPRVRARARKLPELEPLTLATLNIFVPQDRLLVKFKDDLTSAKAAGNVSNMEAALSADLVQLRELTAVSEAIAKQVEAVRARLAEGLAMTEERAFSCKIGSATLAAPPTSAEIFDIAQIPAGLMQWQPDKVKIGQLLRAGASVAGAALTTKSDKPVLRVAFEKSE